MTLISPNTHKEVLKLLPLGSRFQDENLMWKFQTNDLDDKNLLFAE